MSATQLDVSRWIAAVMHEAIGGFIGTREKRQVCLVVSEDRSLWSRYVHGGFATGGSKLTGWLRSCEDHGLDVLVEITGDTCRVFVDGDVGQYSDTPPCEAYLDLGSVEPTQDNHAARAVVAALMQVKGGHPPPAPVE